MASIKLINQSHSFFIKTKITVYSGCNLCYYNLQPLSWAYLLTDKSYSGDRISCTICEKFAQCVMCAQCLV